MPCTTYHAGRRLYPSRVLVRSPDGGLAADSVALAEQVRVLNKSRLLRRRGNLSPAAMEQLNRALFIKVTPDPSTTCHPAPPSDRPAGLAPLARVGVQNALPGKDLRGPQAI